jgi:hypothetical protein
MPWLGEDAVLIALCLLAGFTALAGMSTVALALVPALGIGLLGIAAAAGFGVVSLGAGLGAAVLALARERDAGGFRSSVASGAPVQGPCS